MSITELETDRLKLVLDSHEQALAQIAQMKAEDKAQLSPAWLALLAAAKTSDPWIHGFSMIQRCDGACIGSCGFKGPPNADGVVEIAYGVRPEHEGKGFATEAASALVRFALDSEKVRIVRAHTLPQVNASGRVLTKCGFRHTGEVTDPDDGPVWRWEKQRDTAT